jgi:hypothetical protein
MSTLSAEWIAMADSVLYFPSIRVPETEWLTRVLLYWDTVAMRVIDQ